MVGDGCSSRNHTEACAPPKADSLTRKVQSRSYERLCRKQYRLLLNDYAENSFSISVSTLLSVVPLATESSLTISVRAVSSMRRSPNDSVF